MFEKCEKILQGFWKENLSSIDIYGYKCTKEIFYITITQHFIKAEFVYTFRMGAVGQLFP